MNFYELLDNAKLQYLTGTELTTTILIVFMLASFAFGSYIFLIYRMNTNSSFYSPAFGKTLIGMSVVTTGIILAMQGSLVISLGMVGALSIVRFRTAVKSTADLLFLFWAISIGIVCGTGLLELAFVLCLIMTIVAIGVDYFPMGNRSYILVINATEQFDEASFLKTIQPLVKHVQVRTRSCFKTEKELLLELHCKKCEELMSVCSNYDAVKSASLIFHDGEVRF